MKRFTWPLIALAGAILLGLLLPRYDAALPRGLTITRRQARERADVEARKLQIDVDKAWPVVIWEDSDILEKEFASKPVLRRRAESDPVVGPRLSGFRVTYFRLGLEKFPEYGVVIVGKDGRVLSAQRRARAEEPGGSPSADALRPRADVFVASRTFPGAPSPVFEEERPTVLRGRTDRAFRYRVTPSIPTGEVSFYLSVGFIGDDFAGWMLSEEYKDGRRFRYETGGDVAGLFLRYGGLIVLLLILLAVFLRKYHAGELGVGTAMFIFLAVIALSVAMNAATASFEAYGSGFGGLDARLTTYTWAGFRFLFFDLPIAILVFLAWAVGESIARERWGERLASFDALLKRDGWNATVGRSLLIGLCAAPAVAAAALVPPLIPLLAGAAHATLGGGAGLLLSTSGGPFSIVLAAACRALTVPAIAILFTLASFHRRRMMGVGILLALGTGLLLGALLPNIDPLSMRLLAGFGGTLACIGVFLAADLLAASVAIFAGSLVLDLVPMLRGVSGDAVPGPLFALLLPVLALLLLAALGVGSGREVAYTYEDLAPHVRRIVERERIKAEIDAANRIQSALLPGKEPELAGTSVASHYRAATEIGGDYFDFLPLPGGKLGLAFGDVSGHGLTSGIVMAMTKSALLVQVGYDPSPARVMTVLNDIVMKTAPKRILMTFFYGVLDGVTRTLTFASAGHLDPYIYRADSGRLESLSSWGFPLGVRRREPFRELEARFDPGDRLVLYSDGLIEALDDDGDPFGFERFERILLEKGKRNAGEIRKALLDSVKSFTRNRPPEDDQTLVVLSFDDVSERALRKAG